ncbi:unnamed protein product, partial [Rhizoctonia solani]
MELLADGYRRTRDASGPSNRSTQRGRQSIEDNNILKHPQVSTSNLPAINIALGAFSYRPSTQGSLLVVLSRHKIYSDWACTRDKCLHPQATRKTMENIASHIRGRKNLSKRIKKVDISQINDLSYDDLCERGYFHLDRFRRSGNLGGIEEAIKCYSRALELTPDGHPDLPGRHASLGVSYTDRYRRTGDVADLEKALECDSRALELTPDGHPGLPGRHANL